MEPEPESIASLPAFPPILWLNLPFSLVQPSSRLTLHLYAKYSAHPNILLGTHEMQIPLASQSGSFYWESPLLNRLNITRVDIPCVLENDVGETARRRSMQPATLYITVEIKPPTPYNSPSIPTEDGDSPAEKATLPGRIQSPSSEHPLPLSHHQPVEAGNNKPQSCEEVLPAGTKDLRLALDQADQSMKQMDRSNTWQGAVGRIKWVMDTLSPIAEVRVIPFDVLG